MTSEDEIRTARAVQYRKVERAATVTTRGHSSSPPFRPLPPILPRDELRKYDTIHPIIGFWDDGQGRETYVSCLQRGFDVDTAHRVIEWQCENPQDGGELSAVERYLARNVKPWDIKLPRPVYTPAVAQLPPYPPSPSPQRPPDYPSWSPLYISEKTPSRPPLRKMKKLNLRSSTNSPPPRPSCEVLDHHFTKVEKAETRRHPPVSYLTEAFRRDERHAREAKEGLERRMKEQEQERLKQEEQTKIKIQMEDVPDYIKDLARKWREKYPGPDALFRKDFDFGPKVQTDKNDYSRRPLSPCSSSSILPGSFPEVHNKSLKRQRHDSSNTDAARESPHDRLRTISSYMPISRFAATMQTSRVFSKCIGAPEAHPGRLVHYESRDESRFEAQRKDAGTLTSDYNLNDVVNRFETKTMSEEVTWTSNRTVVDRDSYCEEDLRHHLETVSSQQGKPKETVDETQAAVDDGVRMKTCGIQRRPRTMRGHPSDLSPLSRTRAVKPQGTDWSPSMRANNLTRTPTQTSTMEQVERRERKSYVARCRSTDVFLRDIRESQRIRQLMREAEHSLRPGQDTPDPRCPKDEDDWLGSDPL